jgi:hypothetical protein
MTPRFIVSLDFEQGWGMEATKAYGRERESILGGRKAVPAILELAEQHSIRCTWATVGLLFFNNRDELLNALPDIRPRYADPALSPYDRLSQLGHGEKDDCLHFARSLVELIRDCPGQELAGHTFSHYYCLEDGNDPAAFEADLAAARSAASAIGVELRSIVFPRNQLRPSYLPLCRAAGYRSFRGNQSSSLYRARARHEEKPWTRLLRGADSFLPLSASAWPNRPRPEGGMIDISASRFLRPVISRSAALNRLHLRRIKGEMTAAARQNEIFHLWWHPSNFGRDTDSNLRMLSTIFDHYRRLAGEYGMASATMDELAAEEASANGYCERILLP